jgi:hypothetical protein
MIFEIDNTLFEGKLIRKEGHTYKKIQMITIIN